MKIILSSFVGLITFVLLLVVLILGFSILTVFNIPRALLPIKSVKILLSKVSNVIGDITVYACKLVMILMHGKNIQVFDEGLKFNNDEWYMAISNHQSWADIFILLVTANYKIPLLKFFMKKELAWIPIIYLANKTLNMPFVNRHSRSEIKKNPELRNTDYENTRKSCKRFLRTPSTIMSYAEGTRLTKEKHLNQNSPYKNLLIPKIGGIAIALSAIPEINSLIDYSIVYKSKKRSAWSFLNGDMKHVKVKVKKYDIPNHLKKRNYVTDMDYREEFKKWIEGIWAEKDETIEKLKF